jgi:hypothetical protein
MLQDNRVNHVSRRNSMRNISVCLLFRYPRIAESRLWLGYGQRAATRIRSELMAAIYDKALKRKDFSGITKKRAAPDSDGSLPKGTAQQQTKPEADEKPATVGAGGSGGIVASPGVEVVQTRERLSTSCLVTPNALLISSPPCVTSTGLHYSASLSQFT